MKETIQRLQAIADRAIKYQWKDESQVVIKLSDIRAVLEFYKSASVSEYTEQELNCKSGCMGPCGQCKDEPQNVPDITPEWGGLDEKFKWVAIDPDGVEIAFIRKPQKLQKYMHGCNAWVGRNCQSTGRFIDMKGIDWTKTLSKRPVK